ncbi:MAG: glycoside hydrolase family 76 protein [Acidimicrobiales bacterium]|nr:glycoside hydrolase family 76 protein [Acidimicrobiales bacterium]
MQGDAGPVAGERRQLSDADRAGAAWSALVDLYLDRGRGGRVKVRDQPGSFSPVAALWPLTQVMAGALHVARLHGDDELVAPLFALLDGYRPRRSDGYLPFPGRPPLYYDDNAWVGLVQVQAAFLASARGDRAAADGFGAAALRTFHVVAAGQRPDGAVRWRDRPDSPVNTCATAPLVQLALRLAAHDEPGERRDRLVAVAAAADGALARLLRRDDALYADHVEPDGRVDPAVWAYNQGTPAGADVSWWRLTGDESRLERAAATATASLRLFAGERLWVHPPVFVAVWFRNLLTLHAVRPVPGLLDALDGYLDRVWREARHPGSGAFGGGGLGRYGDGGVIDHAGLTQLYALRAWDPRWWPEIC